MSLIVEQGINRDLMHGSVLAWKFLAANKVPDAVILRVLADPSKRRETDLSAATRVSAVADAGAARYPLSD